MRVSINQHERSLAILAVELGDKECERARGSLEQLHVEILEVTALQGRVDALRKELKASQTHVYEWGFDQRRALSICLRIYRDKLRGLSRSEDKLLVETSSTDEKISDISDFLGRLAGQESLFRDDEDDDPDGDEDEETDPPPPKLTDGQVAAVRHAAEIGVAVE